MNQRIMSDYRKERKYLLLLFLLVTQSAWAQWNYEGSGTVSEPYLIPSAEVWDYLADQVNAGNTFAGKYFRQTGDFTVSSKIIGHPTDDTHFVTFDGIYDGKANYVAI